MHGWLSGEATVCKTVPDRFDSGTVLQYIGGYVMRKERIVGRLEPVKPRVGVLPTRVERDRTKYTRKVKHRAHGIAGDPRGKPQAFLADF